MPNRFLNSYRGGESTLQLIRGIDMAGVVRPLVENLRTRDSVLDPYLVRAAISATVSCQAASVVLFANRYGNLEARFPALALTHEWLYTVPGTVIFFAMPGHFFDVTRYRLDGDALGVGETLRITAGTPLIIDGNKELFCVAQQDDPKACVLSFNYPDPTKDIIVYCKRALRKLAWLPADQEAQRMLVGLEAMSAIDDPQILKVAVKLNAHSDIEVRRAARKLLKEESLMQSGKLTLEGQRTASIDLNHENIL